jgi:hypothetical protein
VQRAALALKIVFTSDGPMAGDGRLAGKRPAFPLDGSGCALNRRISPERVSNMAQPVTLMGKTGVGDCQITDYGTAHQ